MPPVRGEEIWCLFFRLLLTSACQSIQDTFRGRIFFDMGIYIPDPNDIASLEICEITVCVSISFRLSPSLCLDPTAVLQTTHGQAALVLIDLYLLPKPASKISA